MKARLPSRLRRLFWKRERQLFKARIAQTLKEYYGLPPRFYRKISTFSLKMRSRLSGHYNLKRTKPRAV